jgi:hypothetical protein
MAEEDTMGAGVEVRTIVAADRARETQLRSQASDIGSEMLNGGSVGRIIPSFADRRRSWADREN